MKTKRKPKTKLVRVDLTREHQIKVNAIMGQMLRDPTRPGCERVSQKSAIMLAVEKYAETITG